MTEEQAREIEQRHNVYVDAETEMYTTGDRGDEYGWLPVPEEWMGGRQQKGSDR